MRRVLRSRFVADLKECAGIFILWMVFLTLLLLAGAHPVTTW